MANAGWWFFFFSSCLFCVSQGTSCSRCPCCWWCIFKYLQVHTQSKQSECRLRSILFNFGDGKVAAAATYNANIPKKKRRERCLGSINYTIARIGERFFDVSHCYCYCRKCSITHVSVSLWLNKIVFLVLWGGNDRRQAAQKQRTVVAPYQSHTNIEQVIIIDFRSVYVCSTRPT